MAESISIDLLAELESVRLLSAPQWGELREWLRAAPSDPAALGALLCQRGWLTPYQLEVISRGDGRSLVLGAYQLLEPLGEGGMGRVFKARHALMDRVVALKVIRPEWLADEPARRRFQAEIKAIARLRHRHVVLAHDALEIDGQFVLAMEYCDGVDLAKLVAARGPLPVAAACGIARQAAKGLQHIHEHGFVHRDIKPQNLMLTGGRIKLLDLGLARLRPDGDGTLPTALTSSGMVVGTPDFLAPEQAGDSHAADIRADIYSLGATLYFLLTDQVPFPGGAAMEKVLRHRLESPMPLARLRPDVAAGVVAIVERMMEKNPEHRFQTPAEVAAALAPWSRSSSKSTTPVDETDDEQPPLRTARPSRRAALMGLGVIGAAVMGAAALSLILRRRSGDHGPGHAPGEPPAPGAWRALAALKAPVGGAFGLAFDPARPRLAVAGGTGLDRLEPGIVWMVDLESRTWRQLGTQRVTVSRVGFRKDGRVLVSATGLPWSALMRGRGDVTFWNLETNGETVVTPVASSVHALAIDPRDRWVALGARTGELKLLSLEDGSEAASHVERFPSAVTAVAFSSDGEQLACGHADSPVRLFTSAGLLKRRDIFAEVPRVPISGLAFRLQDQELIAGTWQVGTGDSEIRRFNLPEKSQREHRCSASHIRCMALMPDGRSLALGLADRSIRMWDLEANATIAEVPDAHPASIESIAISSDGRLMASSSFDGTVRLWSR